MRVPRDAQQIAGPQTESKTFVAMIAIHASDAARTEIVRADGRAAGRLEGGFIRV